MNNVLVSVLMPVYNAERYLEEAIDSILNQTYTNFEFIIINDGSVDRSKEIILSYNDSRIAYYENERNLKLVESLNRGFLLCRGKYIARMDADDISFPDRIEKQVAFMEAHPEVGLLGTAGHSIGFKGGDFYYESEDQMIRFKLLHECHLLHPAVMIRTKVIRDHNLRMTILHGEDYDFFIQMAEHSKLANLKEVLLYYRQVEQSMSKSNQKITYDHSNLIKLGLFNKLDSSLTTEDVELFVEFAYQNYTFVALHLYRIEAIIKKMLEGNSKHNLYQQQAFIDYLTELWFAFLNQPPVSWTKFKKVLHSDINRFRKKDPAYKLKVFTKMALHL
jgi:glycosyltransferase involved in cell wall biosynthesis